MHNLPDPTRTGKHFDYLVIGGGLFGAYTALYLSGRGYRVCLLERERALFKKASVVNQARLHSGYHYPRSIATARLANEHKQRFIEEHRSFINFAFEQYYAIDRFNSMTSAAQFERFCDALRLPAQPCARNSLVKCDRIEAVYRAEEYSFDPYLIANYYVNRIKDSHVTVFLGRSIRSVELASTDWLVATETVPGGDRELIRAESVISATYSGTNTILRLFGAESLDVSHEISELAIVASPDLAHTGFTVMDGPFFSIMPYGRSGLLSLSSVIYTHHAVSHAPEPSFECQTRNPLCAPDRVSVCNTCTVRPASNYRKMIAQARQYLRDDLRLDYIFSLFTVKTKLKSSHIDDSRPTVIRRIIDDPPFYCLFAGKVNSIYEIERQLPDA